jgi:hypothetical protein
MRYYLCELHVRYFCIKCFTRIPDNNARHRRPVKSSFKKIFSCPLYFLYQDARTHMLYDDEYLFLTLHVILTYDNRPPPFLLLWQIPTAHRPLERPTRPKKPDKHFYIQREPHCAGLTSKEKIESIKTFPPFSRKWFIVSNCAVLASRMIQAYLLLVFCTGLSSLVIGPPIESLPVSRW